MSLPSRESLWDVRIDLAPDTIPFETYHGLLFFPAVFILRTYCIYGRSLKVASLIGVFLLAEVIVKLVSFSLLFSIPYLN